MKWNPRHFKMSWEISLALIAGSLTLEEQEFTYTSHDIVVAGDPK